MMTLLDIKNTFSHLNDDDFVFKKGFDTPHVYALEYEEIAFEPANNIRLHAIKRDIHRALTDVFSHPYHGTCRYAEYTPVNLAFIGCSGDNDIDNFQKLVTDMLNEYSDAHQRVEPKKKRKTAAEKRAEEQANMYEQQDKEWEVFKAEYPEKFAALMYDFFKFQNSGTQTSVNRVDDGYEFSWVNWTRQTAIFQATPPEKYSWDYEDAFNDAIQAIQDQRDKEAEANRILIAKNAALAKLTAEEKKLLGL